MLSNLLNKLREIAFYMQYNYALAHHIIRDLFKISSNLR